MKLGMLVGVCLSLGMTSALACNQPIVKYNPSVLNIGTVSYPQTLPLQDGQVVLTFDDGPSWPTPHILDILQDHCLKATFFVVGNMAKERPEVLKRMYAEGHNVATHTQRHRILSRSSYDVGKAEVSQGIDTVQEILRHSPAPFFRFPGLGASKAIETYVHHRGVYVWSVDIDSLDWRFRDRGRIIFNVLTQLAQKKKGIILLHDIHGSTLNALPSLIRALKTNGYTIVHVN